jgi:hypothetical protein
METRRGSIFLLNGPPQLRLGLLVCSECDNRFEALDGPNRFSNHKIFDRTIELEDQADLEDFDLMR